MAEDTSVQEKRRMILQVQGDATLSATEKARKIQEIMNPKFAQQQREQELARINHKLTAEELETTWHECTNNDGEVQREVGCVHYKRGCKLKAACCGQYFPCLRCHDETKDHPMIRYDIERILCQYCKKEQEPQQDCVSCGKRLGKYYCEVCRFYDNDEKKTIYHCPHCRICRIGKGLGIDHEHCHTCKTCLKIGVDHKCIENSMLGDCPICKQYLFTSTQPVHVLPRCGHAIHVECLTEYRKTNWRCPVCSKSFVPPDNPHIQAVFRAIAREIELQPMPEELANIPVEILCNDCDRKSTVMFHYVGHRCPHCTSFNTRRIKAEPIHQHR